MNVRFLERTLQIDDVKRELEHPIDDIAIQEDVVIVLYDPDSFAEANGRFHNLVALDLDGRLKWTAQLPTSNPGDRYYEIGSKEPLTVYSTQSFDCVIDVTTGRIIAKTFTK
jgi:hypothetical protein